MIRNKLNPFEVQGLSLVAEGIDEEEIVRRMKISIMDLKQKLYSSR